MPQNWHQNCTPGESCIENYYVVKSSNKVLILRTAYHCEFEGYIGWKKVWTFSPYVAFKLTVIYVIHFSINEAYVADHAMVDSQPPESQEEIVTLYGHNSPMPKGSLDAESQVEIINSPILSQSSNRESCLQNPKRYVY